MENREQNIVSDLNAEEIEIINNTKKSKKAKDKFKELVKKDQEMRRREVMEMHPIDINEDSEVSRKRKKEAMRKMKKEKTINHNFHCITKHARREAN